MPSVRFIHGGTHDMGDQVVCLDSSWGEFTEAIEALLEHTNREPAAATQEVEPFQS